LLASSAAHVHPERGIAAEHVLRFARNCFHFEAFEHIPTRVGSTVHITVDRRTGKMVDIGATVE